MSAEWTTPSVLRGRHVQLEPLQASHASEEGILRQQMRHRDGSLRDTVCFSILGSEWPAVKAGLQQKLERHGNG